MKTTILSFNKSKVAVLFIALFSIAGLSSCSDIYYPNGHYGYGHQRHYKSMPPGQAKKYYGAKSARDFAPGHNKRYYRY